MNPTVYIETSVISYLTARPSRALVVAAYQQITREWWRDAPRRFELVSSELVVSEAAAGDAHASRARLRLVEDINLPGTNEETRALAEKLIEVGAVPRKAADDAAHIAIAVANGVDYLVTWNFRHIANATMRSTIEDVCRAAGYKSPVVCTPNELLEG